MAMMFRIFLLCNNVATGFILNSQSLGFNAMRAPGIKSIETRWENIEPQYVPRVMDRYFGEDVCKKNCKVFCVDGIPAASIVFKDTNEYNDPIIEDIYMNKELLLIFDVGPTMRATLYKIHKRIDLNNATGRESFLMC